MEHVKLSKSFTRKYFGGKCKNDLRNGEVENANCVR